MAGLADTVSDALGVAAPGGGSSFPPGYTGRVPDSESRAILAEEARKYPDNPDIRREIELRFPDMARSSSAAAQGFSAGPVIDALKAAPLSAPAAAPKGDQGKRFYGTDADSEAGAGEVLKAGAQAVGSAVSGVGSSILGGWRGLATVASGGSLEDAANAVHQTAAEGTYRPPEGSAGATAVRGLESPYNPLNWPGMVAHKAGEVTADVTGSPAAGAAVETIGNVVVPGALLKAGGKVSALTRRSALPVVDAEVVPPKQTPISQIGQAENLEIPTIIRRGGKVAVEAPGRAPLSLVPKEGETPPAAAGAVPKPVLTLAPNEATAGRQPTLDLTPPEAAAKAAEEAAPKFTDKAPVAEVGKVLPQQDQAERAAVLQRIGLDEARTSAVTGDAKAAATDFQASKLDNKAGDYMRRVLDNERAALTNHADQIVRDTGGTPGVDAQTLESRGHAILQPLDSLKSWFDTQTRALYKAADERAKGTPISLNNFNSVLNDASELTNSDRVHLQSGISAYLKKLGMAGDDGSVAGSAQQAETIRKYLNEQWSPQNSKLVGKLKDAIDDDVTRAAGDDIYAKARKMREMRAVSLDDPNGIARIMDASGPEGINRKVPAERIADTITALPNAQFAHIVETLKHVPPELQGQAQGALAEIKAQFANRIREAGSSRVGQWGARDVTAYLSKNSSKLAQVFDEGELARISDLNDAGHILAQDRSYPGAAVQGHNLVQRGVMAALPKIGAGVGAYLLGPAGAVVGEGAMSRAAGKFGDASALKATQKRVTKLADFPK